MSDQSENKRRLPVTTGGRVNRKQERRGHAMNRLLHGLRDARARFPSHLPFTESTFCPRLYNRAFIAESGEIYACCRHVPHPSFGNLHRTTLERAWNGSSARFWRWASPRGGLSCRERCRLLSQQELAAKYDAEAHPREVPYERLTGINILFGELCNISCIMCDQDHQSRRHLTLDLMKRQIRWDHIEQISIQGGEPLAIKECKATYLYLTEELGKRVNFLTNGTLITEEWAEKIARGSLRTPISINAATKEIHELVNRGSRWEKVLQGVERLRSARDRLGTPLRLIGHFTIVPENVHESADFIALARGLGFEEVQYGFDTRVPAYLQGHPELLAELRRRFDASLESPGVQVDLLRLVPLGLVDAGFSNEWTLNSAAAEP